LGPASLLGLFVVVLVVVNVPFSSRLLFLLFVLSLLWILLDLYRFPCELISFLFELLPLLCLSSVDQLQLCSGFLQLLFSRLGQNKLVYTFQLVSLSLFLYLSFFLYLTKLFLKQIRNDSEGL